MVRCRSCACLLNRRERALMPREGFARKPGKLSKLGRFNTLASNFSGDKILNMNAFSNSFSLLLDLGAEPKDLTFIQISLRGVVVFIATLIMVRIERFASPARTVERLP